MKSIKLSSIFSQAKSSNWPFKTGILKLEIKITKKPKCRKKPPIKNNELSRG